MNKNTQILSYSFLFSQLLKTIEVLGTVLILTPERMWAETTWHYLVGMLVLLLHRNWRNSRDKVRSKSRAHTQESGAWQWQTPGLSLLRALKPQPFVLVLPAQRYIHNSCDSRIAYITAFSSYSDKQSTKQIVSKSEDLVTQHTNVQHSVACFCSGPSLPMAQGPP
jgi:hypothetical protein